MLNQELDNIQSGLQNIFKKLEISDNLSLERIKSEFLGKKEDINTVMELFDKHLENLSKQVGISMSLTTLQKV